MKKSININFTFLTYSSPRPCLCYNMRKRNVFNAKAHRDVFKLYASLCFRIHCACIFFSFAIYTAGTRVSIAFLFRENAGREKLALRFSEFIPKRYKWQLMLSNYCFDFLYLPKFQLFLIHHKHGKVVVSML